MHRAYIAHKALEQQKILKRIAFSIIVISAALHASIFDY